MHNYKNLKIWDKGISISTKIFLITRNFPKSEIYGLISQMNRSSVSIPSNIAEGSARESNKDLYRFLSIAQGSNFELETQLIISKNIDLISKEIFEEIIEDLHRLQKMIYRLKISLKVTGIKVFLMGISWLF